MFTVNQIITSTKLQRQFSKIANAISEKPQAFLITREKGRHMVLVDAEIFGDLMEFKYSAYFSSSDSKSDS